MLSQTRVPTGTQCLKLTGKQKLNGGNEAGSGFSFIFPVGSGRGRLQTFALHSTPLRTPCRNVPVVANCVNDLTCRARFPCCLTVAYLRDHMLLCTIIAPKVLFSNALAYSQVNLNFCLHTWHKSATQSAIALIQPSLFSFRQHLNTLPMSCTKGLLN